MSLTEEQVACIWAQIRTAVALVNMRYLAPVAWAPAHIVIVGDEAMSSPRVGGLRSRLLAHFAENPSAEFTHEQIVATFSVSSKQAHTAAAAMRKLGEIETEHRRQKIAPGQFVNVPFHRRAP